MCRGLPPGLKNRNNSGLANTPVRFAKAKLVLCQPTTGMFFWQGTPGVVKHWKIWGWHLRVSAGGVDKRRDSWRRNTCGCAALVKCHFLWASCFLAQSTVSSPWTSPLLALVSKSCHRLMEEGLGCQVRGTSSPHADSPGGERSLIRTVPSKYCRPKGQYLVVKLQRKVVV